MNIQQTVYEIKASRYNHHVMKLTSDQTKKVAKLANLPLENSDIEKYSDQLSAILEYVDQLNSVKTDQVEPTYNVSGLKNVLAKDEVGDCTLSQEEALANGSNTKDGFFVTKGVFSDE